MAKPKPKSKGTSLPPATKQRGETIEFKAEEIGGELISLLSEGLYKNPLDALREYVQNSIDAKARSVTIKFTGRAVFIRDTGKGMTKDELVRARRFAVSDKSVISNVGFRGIGIYAAFHICDRMKIRSKPVGHTEYVADYDFAQMRRELGDARRSAKHDATSLAKLLTNYVTFDQEETGFEDSRTIVELHNVSTLYYGDLSNPDLVEAYLLDTVPISFDVEFEHRDEIAARLRDILPLEQQPISISLEYGGKPARPITKKMPHGLERPIFHEVLDKSGKKQAFIWGCRNKIPYKIEGHAGFIYKLKGFTIGTRADLRDAFAPRAMLYPWFTGEIYVLNDNVMPNAARDAFEYSPASYQLDLAARRGLEPYVEDAKRFQIVKRAETVIDRIAGEFARLQAKAETGILSPIESYELVKCEKEARRQATSLTKYEPHSPQAAEVKSRAVALRNKLKDLIKIAQDRQPSEEEGAPLRREPRSAPPGEGSDEALSFATSMPTFSTLVAAYDYDDAHEIGRVLDAFVEAIEEVIPGESQAYRDLYDAVQSHLVDDESA